MIGLVPGVGNWAAGGIIAKDLYDDKNLVKNQQMLFAVAKLYFDFLDNFIKA